MINLTERQCVIIAAMSIAGGHLTADIEGGHSYTKSKLVFEKLNALASREMADVFSDGLGDNAASAAVELVREQGEAI